MNAVNKSMGQQEKDASAQNHVKNQEGKDAKATHRLPQKNQSFPLFTRTGTDSALPLLT